MSTLGRFIAHGEVTGVLPPASTIAAERLAPLVFDVLGGHASEAELRAELRPFVAHAAAADLAQTHALLELAELASGLDVLVLKGAANGPLLYGSGALRPREDIDVWLDGWDAARTLADRLLEAGYREVHQLPGRVARHAIAVGRGPFERVDVHAMCARRVRVARALPFAEAWVARRSFELDGETLHTLAAEHAWWLGAMHLSAHHAGQAPPLVLVEDLRRLAAQLPDEAWTMLLARVRAQGLVSAVRHGVLALVAYSPAAVPALFVAALQDEPDDASASFAHAVAAGLDDLDLLDADDGIEYLRELLYPPSEYLHAHLGVATERPRAVLAMQRLAGGVVARLRDGGHNSR